MLSFIFYPATCVPNGYGSSSVAAEAAAILLLTYILILSQTGITDHSRAPASYCANARASECWLQARALRQQTLTGQLGTPPTNTSPLKQLPRSPKSLGRTARPPSELYSGSRQAPPLPTPIQEPPREVYMRRGPDCRTPALEMPHSRDGTP